MRLSRSKKIGLLVDSLGPGDSVNLVLYGKEIKSLTKRNFVVTKQGLKKPGLFECEVTCPA